MADIILERLNASTVRLYFDDKGIEQDLSEHFTYEEPGFTKNKWTKWDGVQRLYKKRGGLLPYGCVPMLFQLAKTRGWTVEVDEAFSQDITPITREEVKQWVDSLNIHSNGIKIEPYDYQLEAVYLSIRYSRMVILAATSAGKSLIIYLLARYYETMYNENNKKILIVVPSQMLVDQLYADFEDYSSENGWNVSQKVHTIMEGRPKTARKMLYISTWQSIYEESEDYHSVFGSVVVDEVHGASGKSISGIMNKCVNAYHRIGLTGSIKKCTLHPVLLTALFSQIRRVVSTKELIEQGRATPIKVNSLMLNYDAEESKYVSSCNYRDEIDYIIRNEYRNKVLASLIISIKGNTLVMFERKEHIESIKNLLESMDHNKSVYVIQGSVDKEDRAIIKAIAEKEDDVVVLGTSGCVSTGLSIKKLRNLVFAHPSKSLIKILQACGRILRLHEQKESAVAYDLVDNFSYKDEPNYALKHAVERVGIYRDESFPVTFKNITMKQK